MSVRSEVFIKYVLEFTVPSAAAGAAGAVAGALAGAAAVAGAAVAGAAAGATTKLKVSNDALAGDFCIDADISVKMHRWRPGVQFEIKLYDLPEPKVEALKASFQHPSMTPTVTISLGYFDTKVEVVLEGVYEKVSSEPGGDKLVTTIAGREKGSFACATTPYTGTLEGKNSYAQVISKLLAQAPLPKDCMSKKPKVNDNLTSKPLQGYTFPGTVLSSIDDLAKRANAEFLIVDGTLFFGAPILNELVSTLELDYAVNLAKFEWIATKIQNPSDEDSPDSKPGTPIIGFKFTTVGDPKMRPGQKVVVNSLKDLKSPDFRIRHVEHSFTTSGGYTCVGVAQEQFAVEQLKNGAKVARQIDAVIDPTPDSAATRVTDSIRSQPVENPVIEVAAVKSEGNAFQASLYYGQKASGSETQPSINTAVIQQEDHVYKDKPILSPFAWRKCGLVTPVYPGMKAVLVHNRAQASDAIVAGYIWSKQPDFPAPANHSGDWWLCLPIDLNATQPPDDSTKAVNDITANNGCRIIELKGLKITVGAAGLKEVGKRPNPEDAKVAEACTIAHASGAVITVQDSQIDVDTGAGPKLTLSSSGITVTDGKLNVRLENGKLAIG